MKDRDKKSTVNLHGGLRPDSKTRKYQKCLRADAPDDSEEKDAEDWYDADFETGDGSDLHDLALHRIIQCLARPMSSAWDALPEAANVAEMEPLAGIAKENLVSRLASHIETIGATTAEWTATDHDYIDELRDRSIDALLGLPRAEAEAAYMLRNSQPALTNALVVAVLFHPFWIRRLSEWEPLGCAPSEMRRSLVEHLFVRYQVPDFLYANWQREAQLPRLKWICWFIIQAQGASLKKAAKLFGWRVGGRLQGLLQRAPSDLNTLMGVIWAEVQRLGGNDRVFNRLVSAPSYVQDVTSEAGGLCEGDVAFWEGAVRWLVKHDRKLSDDDAVRVLNWAAHERSEVQRARRLEGVHVHTFQWDRLRRTGAIRRATAYHEACWQSDLHTRTPQQWDPRGWGWTWDSLGSGLWSVEELCTSQELAEEGAAMHHCVVSYDRWCAMGICAVCSLRHDGRRVLTIECNPKTVALTQIRGACNRQPTADEMQIVSIWWQHIQSS